MLDIKFFDYNEEKRDLISLGLSNVEFLISKPEIKLIIEHIIPFNDCFYMTLPLKLKEKHHLNIIMFL